MPPTPFLLKQVTIVKLSTLMGCSGSMGHLLLRYNSDKGGGYSERMSPTAFLLSVGPIAIEFYTTGMVKSGTLASDITISGYHLYGMTQKSFLIQVAAYIQAKKVLDTVNVCHKRQCLFF